MILRLLIINILISNILSQDDLNLFFDNENLLFPQESYKQQFPDAITTDDSTLHIVWMNQQGSNKNIMYSRSYNNGDSFSNPIQINQHSNSIVAYIQAGPKIKVRDNELIIMYMDDRSGWTSIYLNHSSDNGINWSEDILISDQSYLQAYPDIEASQDGKLHLVYYSYNQNYSFNSVRYSYANSGSFDFELSISAGITNEVEEPCDCCQPDLEVVDSGDLYLAFRNNIENYRDHFLAIKTIESENFDQIIQVSNYNDFMGGCPSSGPSLEISNDIVAIGYRVVENISSFINYANLDILEFNNEVNVHVSDASQNYLDIAINNNYIHSVWIDESLGSMDIFYGAHETGSDILVNVQRMNQNIEESPYVQKDPKLHWHNDILFCIWSDQRMSNYQIYYRRSNTNLVLGDINSDGVIDILDIIMIVNIIISGQYNGLADLNSDGIINVLDIIQVVNIILNN